MHIIKTTMKTMNPSVIHNQLRAIFKPFARVIAVTAGLALGSAQALTTTQTFNLGTSPAGTNFPNAGIDSLVVWIEKGSLPPGSILRSVTATDLKLESNLGDAWASDIGVFIDPSPETPGGPGGLLKIGDDNSYGGAAFEMDWGGGKDNGPFTLSRTAGVDWTGDIDLNTAAVMLGSGYGTNTAYSGTITVEYDVFIPASITSFGPGAVVGELSGNTANISWTVPSGTDVTALAPTFTLSSGTCVPVSGSTQNFTNPVVYTVTDGETINTYTVTVTPATALQWNVAGGGTWDTATSNWLPLPSGSATTFANGNEVIFDNTAGGTITIAPDMSPFSTTVNAASGTYVFSGGPIATGSLTKSGNGNLTITTANTYNGGTVINAGQLKMDVLANAALGTGPVTLNGGRLFLERITATNALIVNGGNLWPDNGFGNNWNGPVTLNSNLIIQGPFYCTTTFNGPISGAGGLTINGDGPIVLAVANSYTGPTSVTACTLTCNNVDALGSGTLSISSTFNSKVNLNFTGTANIAGLILGGVPQTGGTYGSTASDATFKNDTYFVGTGTVTVPPSSAKDILTFSFGVLGAASIDGTSISIEVPTGTDLTNLAPTYTVSPGASGSPVSGTPRNFTTPQTYTITAEDLSTREYTVTVTETVLPDIFTWANAAAGNWNVGSNWTNELATGSAPLASGRPSYTLNFNAVGTYTATNNLSLTGFQLNKLNLGANVTLAGNPLAFVVDGETLPTINQNSGSAVTISTNLDLGDDLTFGGSGGGTVTLSGVISGDGKLTKDGSGTLIVTRNNSFTGGTVINSGTLRINHVDPLQTTGLGSGPITLNGGTLYLFRVTFGNPLIINGGSVLAENGFGNNWNGPITLNATTTFNCVWGLTCSNTISGSGGLNKTNTNTLTLSGTSSYTGPTTVTAGTLRCNSPAAVPGGDLTINSGGAKMNLNYAGTKTVASLTLGGVAKTTPGTYGSVASLADFPDDNFFTPGSTGTVTIAGGSSFDSWSGGAAFDADANNDGVKNGLAWVLGAADKDANALGLLPLSDNTTDPTYFIFTYRRADAANTDSNTTIAVEYGSDLSGWTTATAGPNIIITPTDNFYGSSPGVDKVEVKINRSLAVGGKLFARLKVVKSP